MNMSLSICIIADLLSLNFFYIEAVHSFLHSLLKFYSKQKFIWFMLFGSIYQHYTFFANSYLFHLVLLLKITLFNTVHCDVKNFTRLWWRCYEWKKLELTPLSERICGLQLVQIEPWSTHHKRGLCWIINWQFYLSRSYVRRSLKIPSQYMRRTHEDTRGAP